MRTPEYDAVLTDAKLYPQLWRLLAGLILTIFMTISVSAMLIGAVVAVSGGMDPMATIHVTSGLRSIQTAVQGYGGLDTPVSVLLILLTFVGLFIGPLLAAAAFHFRGPGSLFGSFPVWRRGFLVALGVQVPILAVLVGLGALLDPPLQNLRLGQWLSFLPLALPLILIQTSSEELLFRGYIQQQLAARFNARWIWIGLPALAFAALHYTPDAGANLPLVLGGALVFGLIAADLSAQTGSLGAAMGLHFGNNVFGLLIVGVSETITGLALYRSSEPVDATGGQSLGLGLSILVMLVTWRLVRLILTRARP
jgi:membrane protease YdiL (CAAX protease family)